jgi:hypothetical protein
MKTRLLGLLIAVSFLSGCYANMHLYPAQGPIATQSPLPVFTAKITGRTSGDITLPFVGGEVCKGHWTRVARVQGPTGQTTSTPSAKDMPAVWDAVYGQGFYTSHVLGTWLYGTAVLTGDHGTVMDVEFSSSDNEEHASTRGVARDDKGNIYKVVF